VAGTVRTVESSEPADLAQQMLAGAPVLAGLGLHPQTSEVLYELEGLEGEMGLPRASALSIGGGPAMSADRGMALSSTLGRLFVFGGTQGGSLLGDAWMLDVHTSTWTELDLNETAPGGIVAAAYRPLDRAVYFLERLGSDLFLRRYHAMRRHPEGGAFDTLVRFPTVWNDNAKHSVIIGTEGDIAVFAGSSTTYRVARFTFDAAHVISYAKMVTKTGNTMSSPLLRLEGVSVGVLYRGEPMHVEWPFDQFVVGGNQRDPHPAVAKSRSRDERAGMLESWPRWQWYFSERRVAAPRTRRRAPPRLAVPAVVGLRTSTSTSTSTGTGTGTGSETGWAPVEWAGPDCAVEMASEPEKAVPALTWVPCPSGKAGCEMVNVTWDAHVRRSIGPVLEPSRARRR
jgi:hypothetical protein